MVMCDKGLSSQEQWICIQKSMQAGRAEDGSDRAASGRIFVILSSFLIMNDEGMMVVMTEEAEEEFGWSDDGGRASGKERKETR